MDLTRKRSRRCLPPFSPRLNPCRRHGATPPAASSLLLCVSSCLCRLSPAHTASSTLPCSSPQVTVPSTMQATSRPVTEGFGALNNGPAIRNVLDFSLQDYYGGFSELMSGLSVSSSASSSPKPADPEPSAKTHSERPVYLHHSSAAMSLRACPPMPSCPCYFCL